MMFDWLITYSGYLIIGYCCFGLVTPLMVLRKKYKLQTISQIGSLPVYGWLVNTGLLLVGFLQLLFVQFIYEKYGLQNELGRVVFVLGVTSLFLSGLINVKRSEKLHLFFAKVYFMAITIGALLISLGVYQIFPKHGLILLLIIVVKALSVLVVGQIKKNLLVAETLGIVFSAIWALVIYFPLGVFN